MAEQVNPLAGLTVPQLKAQAIEAKPGVGEFFTDIGEALANSANRTAANIYGGAGSAASWLGAPSLGAALFGMQQQSQDALSQRAQNEVTREQGYADTQAAINAELARRGTAPAKAAAPTSLTFGSALPQGTTAQGGLSFSPVARYNDDQQRVMAMSQSLAGLPPEMFQQLMASMPERPKSPTVEEMAGKDYYSLALKNYVTGMANAASREDQDAALQLFLDQLMTLRKTDTLLAPQVGGNG